MRTRSTLVFVVFVVLNGVAMGGVLYVDDDAPLGGDGQSWNTAFRYLQDALYAGAGAQIRIAGGSYYANRDEAGLVDPGSVYETFPLPDQVALRGGYAGVGAPDPDLRDWSLYQTILEADFGGLNPTRTLVTVDGVTALLEGLTVQNAASPGLNGWIAGVAVTNDARFTAEHCRFLRNNGAAAGGIGAETGSVTVKFCEFLDNVGSGSTSRGAGIGIYRGDLAVENCRFQGNSGFTGGACIHAEGTTVLGNACVFVENGTNSPYSAPATVNGAGASGMLVNCLFVKNYAWKGGIIHPDGIDLFNCTFAGNTANLDSIVVGGRFISNCILRDQGTEFDNSGAVVTYSNVKGGHAGEGNIDADPKFVPGTYELAAGSPCIDAGSNFAVPPGVVEDLEGLPRFVDDPFTPDTGLGDPPLVDMGCYEFQANRLPGDMNCDGVIDFGDINPFVLALSSPEIWHEYYPMCPLENGDINGDGAVDFGDINPFVQLLSR